MSDKGESAVEIQSQPQNGSSTVDNPVQPVPSGNTEEESSNEPMQLDPPVTLKRALRKKRKREEEKSDSESDDDNGDVSTTVATTTPRNRRKLSSDLLRSPSTPSPRPQAPHHRVSNTSPTRNSILNSPSIKCHYQPQQQREYLYSLIAETYPETDTVKSMIDDATRFIQIIRDEENPSMGPPRGRKRFIADLYRATSTGASKPKGNDLSESDADDGDSGKVFSSFFADAHSLAGDGIKLRWHIHPARFH
jgi:hypothetical protein